MKTEVVIYLVAGGIVLIALTIIIIQYWTNRRKKALIEAGNSFGFRHLIQGESISVVLVPLIHRADRKYLLIMRGELNGYEAEFFDLYCSAGDDWFYQSTVMIKNPQVMMPMFQLKSSGWLKVITQRTCGEALKVPDREKDMNSLRLSSSDPQWALQTFAGATPQFFQKLREGKWTIEGYQHSLVIYIWGKKVSPKKLPEYARQAAEIADKMYSLCH